MKSFAVATFHAKLDISSLVQRGTPLRGGKVYMYGRGHFCLCPISRLIKFGSIFSKNNVYHVRLCCNLQASY